MAVEQDRYNALIRRCAFNLSFYKGTYQDLSSAQRAMSVFGTAHRWSELNGWPVIRSDRAGEVRTVAAVAPPVDYTTSFSFELLYNTFFGFPYSYYHVSGGGCAERDIGTGQPALYVYGGGVIVRSLAAPASSAPRSRPNHILFSFRPQIPDGAIWINGLPVVATTVNVGAPTACANDIIYTVDANRDSLVQCGLLRVWSGTMTSEDAACLAEASRLLVGGW